MKKVFMVIEGVPVVFDNWADVEFLNQGTRRLSKEMERKIRQARQANPEVKASLDKDSQ